MLAGKKLLLADDSITIQKVVDLTFADEGVSVVCVNNGREAIERLAEYEPDVVLADVFMPQMNGYEVCEHIKQDEKLKHIPVMLLVGSFEPFDEAEARRVGADDTLTKPFQSIRRLIDKVGMLVSGRREEEQIPTAELPVPEVTPEPEPEMLSEEEIQITTADTQPLPYATEETLREVSPEENQWATVDTKVDEEQMQSKLIEPPNEPAISYEGAGDVLLDLGYYEPALSSPGEDFVLDLDEVAESRPIEASVPFPASVSEASYDLGAGNWQAADDRPHREEVFAETSWSQATVESEAPAPMADQLATTQEFQRPGVAAGEEPTQEATSSAAAMLEEQAQRSEAGAVRSDEYSQKDSTEHSLQQLSPEMIDAIARRAVEHLSERVVQEIAWEVVPQLAELMIKRQLEEKNS